MIFFFFFFFWGGGGEGLCFYFACLFVMFVCCYFGLLFSLRDNLLRDNLSRYTNVCNACFEKNDNFRQNIAFALQER